MFASSNLLPDNPLYQEGIYRQEKIRTLLGFRKHIAN